MAKTYDLFSKSDMRKLERDLTKSIKQEAKNAIVREGFDVECPNCGRSMHATQGLVTRPNCMKITEITFDWSGF